MACARRKATLSYFVVFLALSGTLAALLCAETALAQTPQKWIARAVSVQGAVEARPVGATVWQPIKLNDTFCPGDVIRVQERSRADITLLDQSVLRLNANTTITVEAVQGASAPAWSTCCRGAAHFFSRGPNSLEVQTPFTVAGVRGTEFFIGVEADRTLLTVFEGTVVADNPAGSLTLTGGQSAVAERGKAPTLRSRCAARATPCIGRSTTRRLFISGRTSFRPGPDWPATVRALPRGLRRGRPPAGVRPHRQRSCDRRRSALLRVSRLIFFLPSAASTRRARTSSARCSCAPNDANALALQAIIAVVAGRQGQALDGRQQAVRRRPTRRAALIALSYAQQARFDLEGARASVEQAGELEPQNALAWARLAELRSSFGESRRGA